MGLAERRGAHAFQTDMFPQFQARIEKAAGFAVPVTVEWQELSTPGEAHLYAEGWAGVYFEPLIIALGVVGRDELGAEALKDGLKQIVIRNHAGCDSPACCAKFEAGVLTIDHVPTTNIADAPARATRITAVLEQAL